MFNACNQFGEFAFQTIFCYSIFLCGACILFRVFKVKSFWKSLKKKLVEDKEQHYHSHLPSNTQILTFEHLPEESTDVDMCTPAQTESEESTNSDEKSAVDKSYQLEFKGFQYTWPNIGSHYKIAQLRHKENFDTMTQDKVWTQLGEIRRNVIITSSLHLDLSTATAVELKSFTFNEKSPYKRLYCDCNEFSWKSQCLCKKMTGEVEYKVSDPINSKLYVIGRKFIPFDPYYYGFNKEAVANAYVEHFRYYDMIFGAVLILIGLVVEISLILDLIKLL